MITLPLPYLIIVVSIFTLGYLAIILERYLKINKTAVALLIAVLCWLIYFSTGAENSMQAFERLRINVSEVSQIIFFLMGAMTLVEVIDCHDGFRIITDLIQTTSKRKMLWLIAFTAFFLSSVLDNLTTTILMLSLLRKLIPPKEERFLFSCFVVIAANAGGAWTPIGDVTTTMLWIENRLTSLAVIRALFLPSVISLLVPLLYYSFRMKGKFKKFKKPDEDTVQPGARVVFYLGIAALIFVPIFKGWSGMPPFMGMILGLSLMWIVTDFMHHEISLREHLRVPHILSQIDLAAVLFFLGILLVVGALEAAGALNMLATWLSAEIPNTAVIATAIGIFSAIVDNVPLVAATIGMYPLDQYTTDAPFWHMIAYAAGTGGSIFIIGSAAGIALMGIEKIDFFSYMRKVSLPALVGFLAGMGFYLLAM